MKHLVKGLVAGLSLTVAVACGSGNNAGENTDSTSTTSADTSSFDVSANWKIGTQMWTFNHFTLAQALDKADSAGVKNVECYWGQPLGADMKGEFGINMTDDAKAKLKQLLQSKGIQVVAMGVIAPADQAEWVKAFQLAKDFGLSYITSEPKKDQWNMIDSLAGSYGIKVAIHEHAKPNPYWHPDSVLAAINGHPNIGACADLGHWARSGLDPVECLKKLDGHVYGVHLKDIKTFGEEHAEDTIVGKGVIKFDPIFDELKRQQFRGMISIEHESNWLNNLPDVIETVKFYNDQVTRLK
ncbi:sugar phosphate isomerase/epimerase [Panacibacter sp. DH6]|uniref:Sugar phosphate isomerase/epimerase n=1 Tax=Panacibacter microcysteis TaxID=2793269 RepID=A0A931E8F3_9BACT|nr:sugar phosphate isomerase/epimerase [Panacibacter microcysteis]MBG9376149.1 sugar phosphate isomerase/epimerase [Panacibacter microcysteis]